MREVRLTDRAMRNGRTASTTLIYMFVRDFHKSPRHPLVIYHKISRVVGGGSFGHVEVQLYNLCFSGRFQGVSTDCQERALPCARLSPFWADHNS